MTPTFTLLVCGGRDFRRDDLMNEVLRDIRWPFKEIICGFDPKSKKYQGADQLAWEWARGEGIPCRTFPADWDRYGRGAGPLRNQQMADEKPTWCAAFARRDGSWGIGTRNMLSKLPPAMRPLLIGPNYPRWRA